MDYQAKLRLAKEALDSGSYDKETIEYLFPELKESEDERIRKGIKSILEHYKENGEVVCPYPFVTIEEAIAWLEKQGEKEYALKSFKDEDVHEFVQYIEKQAKAYELNLPNRSYDIYGFAKDILSWFEKQGEKVNIQTVNEVWKDMRLEVGAQASGNRHEPQYSDNSTKLFSLNDIDEIIEKISEKQDKQKSDDKVKAKQTSDLEKGKWYVCDTPRYRDFIVGKAYYCPKNEMLKLKEDELPRYVAKHCFHPWTIQDAKDGDVLAEHETIVLFKEIEGQNIRCYCTYHYLGFNPDLRVDTLHNKNAYSPATQEQRDLLFQKMEEAGYKWDSEKKELKKIEQNPAWNEEDEAMLNSIIHLFRIAYTRTDDIIEKVEFLKSIKNRVQPQTKQEWSEDDKEALRVVTNIFEQHGVKLSHYPAFVHWLKVLPNRITLNPYWKPSDEQMEALKNAAKHFGGCDPDDWDATLESLYNDLKKLK